MQIKYICTFWGCENDTADNFLEKVMNAGYDGIEINLPSVANSFTPQFIKLINNLNLQQKNFVFIPQQLSSPVKNNVSDYIKLMENKLFQLAAYQPNFINSHTGKDYFSFDDNCRIIEAASNISVKTGIRILHETHRGRFSFHAASLIPYLKKFPEMELVGDFSHFCTVSESMLQDQEEIIEQIIPHVSHIHARIGNEQSPQVNDPSAEEWISYFKIFTGWWKKIIKIKQQADFKTFTITPEFGPAPYMPTEPFTQKPLSNQWDNNIYMMNALKKIFS